MRPGPPTLEGIDARALGERGGGADPSVRPGWEKGSVSLDSLPQMLPMFVDRIFFTKEREGLR